MLHLGILPHHEAWSALFANLAVVVVDEAHIYRGVFGSHVANVLRRLRRIAAAYGTSRASCSPRRRSPTRSSWPSA
jgi:DEAD/DEAH box helicase domain-containing protein